MKKMECGGGSIQVEGKVITDLEVAEFVKKHTRFVDRFNIKKMVAASLLSECILMGSVQMPDEDYRFTYKGR